MLQYLSGGSAVATALCLAYVFAARALPRLLRPSVQAAGGHLADVALVTVGWVFMFLTFLFFQSATSLLEHRRLRAEKRKDGAEGAPNFKAVKYGTPTPRMLMVNRLVGNTIEQGTCFLALLWAAHWVCAAASEPSLGIACAGWVWIAFRCLYPVVFMRGPPMLFLSTLPGYAVLFYLVSRILALC